VSLQQCTRVRTIPSVPNTFFHTTAAAEEILQDGFRDAEGSYGLATHSLRGVFVANVPVDCNEGAIGDQVLEIMLPGDVDLTGFELIDEGQHSAYREWCVPAELLNTRAAVRLLTDAEVEARLGQWTDEVYSRRRMPDLPHHREPDGRDKPHGP
jgi:hypothetical protein